MEPTHSGIILREEFLKPMGISDYQLAKALAVPQTRIGADRRGRVSSGDGDRYSLALECQDVIAVAERLALEQEAPIDVFAHSYGELCALAAAARHAPVRRLALYEPPGPQTAPEEWQDRVRHMIGRGQPRGNPGERYSASWSKSSA